MTNFIDLIDAAIYALPLAATVMFLAMVTLRSIRHAA